VLFKIHFLSEKNFRNKQETKKLTTAPITAIIIVKNISLKVIFKIVERNVPPTIPERSCKSFCCIKFYFISLSFSFGLSLSLGQSQSHMIDAASILGLKTIIVFY